MSYLVTGVRWYVRGVLNNHLFLQFIKETTCIKQLSEFQEKTPQS
jgi:hypothetical protein